MATTVDEHGNPMPNGDATHLKQGRAFWMWLVGIVISGMVGASSLVSAAGQFYVEAKIKDAVEVVDERVDQAESKIAANVADDTAHVDADDLRDLAMAKALADSERDRKEAAKELRDGIKVLELNQVKILAQQQLKPVRRLPASYWRKVPE